MPPNGLFRKIYWDSLIRLLQVWFVRPAALGSQPNQASSVSRSDYQWSVLSPNRSGLASARGDAKLWGLDRLLSALGGCPQFEAPILQSTDCTWATSRETFRHCVWEETTIEASFDNFHPHHHWFTMLRPTSYGFSWLLPPALDLLLTRPSSI